MATIDTYFKQMKDEGASDLHLAIGFPPMIRKGGELRPLDFPVITAKGNRQILFEIFHK